MHYTVEYNKEHLGLNFAVHFHLKWLHIKLCMSTCECCHTLCSRAVCVCCLSKVFRGPASFPALPPLPIPD